MAKKRLIFDSISAQEMREDALIEGMARYIAECGARGVNQVLAHAIANRFRAETYEVILNRPDELLTIDGIGRQRAQALHEWFAMRFGENVSADLKREMLRDCGILTTLYAMRLSNWEVTKVRERYGDKQVLQTINENPYQLTEVSGFGFKRVDKIAQAIGYDLHDPRRIAAGIIFTLEQQTNDGHCCLPEDVLAHDAAKELALPEHEVQPVISEMIQRDQVKADLDRIYLPRYYYAEWSVARYLQDMVTARRSYVGVDDIMYDVTIYHPHLNREQLAAIRSVLENGVTVLTGGPGTGKTTTLRGMIKAIHRAGWTFALCAPTGRASKRMGETSGSPAQTIHRLLGYKGDEFEYGIDNELHYDVIICDEASMVDLLLMRSLLDAMKDDARLVLIGDNDQLPSVGPGRVLGDIIASGAVPVIRLQHIYRQTNSDDEVSIINNAHRIINGQMPAVDNPNAKDFFLLNVGDKVIDGKTPEMRAQAELVKMVKDRIPQQWPGCEVQVLTPLRQNGMTSADTLNPLLQDALNPFGRAMKHRDMEFRLDDRVMQTKNDYAKNVYNGDVGRVVNVFPDFDMLTADLGYENTINYHDSPGMRELDDLTLAYAVTIHKSQGSEYDVVVIMLMPSAGRMLQRNLLYTAITRAKKACIIIGNKEAMTKAVAEWRIKPRYTRLKERLNNFSE